MTDVLITIFYQPVLNLLVFLYNIIPGHDLGLAIIALTVIIKLILFPLSQKSIRSQKSLQELQPKMNELKVKYKDNKEQMGRAMMELYKKHKVNPFSSCLPMLIQLPFLIAVFHVFRDGLAGDNLNLLYSYIHRPETIDHIFLGFIDLAKRNIPIAVLAGLAQYWQTKMLMHKRPEVKSKGARDEDMAAIMNKQMMYMMPLLTVFIGSSFPGGLALYWLTTTVLTGLQQVILFKKKNKDGVIEGKVVK